MNVVPKESITPYLSLLLAKNNTPETKGMVHNEIVKVIKELASTENQITLSETSVEESGETGLAKFTGYKIHKDPSWIKSKEFVDIEHHISYHLKLMTTLPFIFLKKAKKMR
jgi:hypothetical protein